MSKTQSFYQSILQNSTLVVKVSGKICDNQQSIENVIGDIKELLSTISKLKVVLVFGFGRQLDHYMKNVHQTEPKKVNGRRITSQDDIEAALKAELRAGENTTLAKFVRNLESRIYAQLSKQLVDNMFGNETDVNSGSFELEGNLIDYSRGQQCDEDGICVDAIIMTIQDSEGSSTEIVIPIGTGGF